MLWRQKKNPETNLPKDLHKRLEEQEKRAQRQQNELDELRAFIRTQARLLTGK
jgi:hypothetical protein